jgi:hypothetical protein
MGLADRQERDLFRRAPGALRRNGYAFANDCDVFRNRHGKENAEVLRLDSKSETGYSQLLHSGFALLHCVIT